MSAGMTPELTAAGADRPMHPALKNIMVFIVGALFGAVCIFIFTTLHPPLPQQPLVCPQVQTAATTIGGSSAPGRSFAPANNSNAVARKNAAQSTTMGTAASPDPTAVQSTSPPTTSSDQIPAPNTPPTERPSSVLVIPVAGIKASQLTDTYTDSRSGGRVHDAIDIMAPRGTQVIAADDGKVAKLFYSKQGGLTVYQFDPSEKFVYYYAHLDSYAPALVEGKQLHRGDPVGLVGFSGNASEAAPHLHFAISVLGPEKHWWQATAINPYPLLSGR